MSSKKYKFVRKVRNIKKHGWLKLKITVATAAVLSGVFFALLIVTCIGNVTSAILALGGSSGGSGESIRGCKDISGEVLAWQQVITDQCRQWMWTEEYVPVVMAIAWSNPAEDLSILCSAPKAPLTHNIRIVRGALLQQNTPFRLALERLNPYWT